MLLPGRGCYEALSRFGCWGLGVGSWELGVFDESCTKAMQASFSNLCSGGTLGICGDSSGVGGHFEGLDQESFDSLPREDLQLLFTHGLLLASYIGVILGLY